jgi:hypothetical protein
LNAGHKKLFKKPQKPLFEFELSTPPNATGWNRLFLKLIITGYYSFFLVFLLIILNGLFKNVKQ